MSSKRKLQQVIESGSSYARLSIHDEAEFVQIHASEVVQAEYPLEASDHQPGTSDLESADWPTKSTLKDREMMDRRDALSSTSPDSQLSSPASPSGETDLHPDAEDTLSVTEGAEDDHREKRRRLLTQMHEDRLKALQQMEGDVDDDVWGGSDEEPDDSQKELMERTANHILASPNPIQLEMRILANHGADKRFAFLKGRWSRFWNTTKDKGRRRQKETVGLGGLTGYGSNDSESNDSESAGENEKSIDDKDEQLKQARRLRLKEWIEKRRAANGTD